MKTRVRVFLQGTAGDVKKHWASSDFLTCATVPGEITYFSANKRRPAIAIHGDHVHILQRGKNSMLVNMNFETAERFLNIFINEMKEKGIEITME